MNLDFSKSLYELVQEYPEVKEIMFELGFKEIKTPGMMQTAGRYMTIPKGAKLKKIPLDEIKKAFEEKGYTIEGVE